jgi:hypothetical protein
MTRNVGNIDRLVRAVVSVVILSLYFIGPQSAWALLGLIPLATAVIGWCPPYSLFGINTCTRHVNRR